MRAKYHGIAVGAALFAFAGALCAPVTARAQGETNTGPSVADKKVTLRLDNSDIRAALKLLFANVPRDSYTIDPAVQGQTTVELTDVPFLTALSAVLKSTESVQKLTYAKEEGIYRVKLVPEETEVKPDENPEVTPETPVKNT